jgi:hypothetical protein
LAQAAPMCGLVSGEQLRREVERQEQAEECNQAAKYEFHQVFSLGQNAARPLYRLFVLVVGSISGNREVTRERDKWPVARRRSGALRSQIPWRQCAVIVIFRSTKKEPRRE